jgi:hypothetical protein
MPRARPPTKSRRLPASSSRAGLLAGSLGGFGLGRSGLDQQCREHGAHCGGGSEDVERDLEAVRECRAAGRGGRLRGDDRDRAQGSCARGSTGHGLAAAHRPLRRTLDPVIGAGVALDRGASAANTVLGFAILVGLGVVGAGWGLLARRPKSSPQVVSRNRAGRPRCLGHRGPARLATHGMSAAQQSRRRAPLADRKAREFLRQADPVLGA